MLNQSVEGTAEEEHIYYINPHECLLWWSDLGGGGGGGGESRGGHPRLPVPNSL